MSSKLYFKYGTLNSSKSSNLLMTAHNYESQGKRVLILKPKTDTRSTSNMVESRVGISHECIDISTNDNIINIIKENDNIINNPLHALLIEEAQFLSKEQVKQLHYIAHEMDIPVLAYGLKNTYIDGQLFEGSSALLFYADSLQEIKTVCQWCERKATQNLRVVDGEPIYDGEPIQIGDISQSKEYYIPVCGHHYFNPKL